MSLVHLSALRRPRVWNGVCVYHEVVDCASERLAGASDCSAAFGTFSSYLPPLEQ